MRTPIRLLLALGAVAIPLSPVNAQYYGHAQYYRTPAAYYAGHPYPHYPRRSGYARPYVPAGWYAQRPYFPQGYYNPHYARMASQYQYRQQYPQYPHYPQYRPYYPTADSMVTETPAAPAVPAPPTVEPAPAHIEPAPAQPTPSPTQFNLTPAQFEPSSSDSKPSLSQFEPSPANIEPSPANIEPGPANIEPSPANIEPSPANIEPGPANIEPGPANIEPSPEEIEPSPEGIELDMNTISAPEPTENSEKASPANDLAEETAPGAPQDPPNIIESESDVPCSHQPVRTCRNCNAPLNGPPHCKRGAPHCVEIPMCPACLAKAGLHEASHCGDCEKKHRRLPVVSIFGDYLYLTARGADVPFAQPFNGVGPLAVPRGGVAVADPDYHSAFRVGGGVALDDCSWIQGTFSWYESRTEARVDTPEGTALRSYLTFPATTDSAFTNLLATANYDIDFLIGDVDYKRVVCEGPHHAVNLLAGARYAHLDQDLFSEFQLLGSTTIDSQITFDGGGPRTGLEGMYRVKCGAFGYGKGIFNLLVGHFGARYEQRSVFAGLQGLTEIGDDRLVPLLEFEAGFGWVSPEGHVRLSAGYYLAAWFNTMTMPALTQAIRAADFTTNGDNFRDTLTFDGLVGRVEFRY